MRYPEPIAVIDPKAAVATGACLNGCAPKASLTPKTPTVHTTDLLCYIFTITNRDRSTEGRLKAKSIEFMQLAG